MEPLALPRKRTLDADLCSANLDRAGIGSVRYDNPLLAIVDFEAVSTICKDSPTGG